MESVRLRSPTSRGHRESAASYEATREKLGLSGRESDVLAWVGQGKTNDQIATILGMSLGTVKKHIEHIFDKLGVENRTAAAFVFTLPRGLPSKEIMTSVSSDRPFGDQKKIRIGQVARHFQVSVDLLRLYEREGLLIPLRSERGSRYFTDRDCRWVGMLLRLVRESGPNLARLRRLLSLLPCWKIRGCAFRRKRGCPFIKTSTAPCWMNKHNCISDVDCYFCPVYRSAPEYAAASPLVFLDICG